MIRRLRRVLLGLVFVALLCGAVWWMARTEPAWYDPPDAGNEEVVVLADRVEYRLVEEMQKVRPVDDSWRLRIRQNQVNTWLSARLMRWIEHDRNTQWPSTLGTPQVRFSTEGFSLAVPIGVDEEGDEKYVIVATVYPEIVDGGLKARLTRVGMGRITLPGSPINRLASVIDEHLREEDERFHSMAQTVLDVLRGDELLDPVIALADDRCVHVLDLELEESSFIVTARTLPDCDHRTLVRRAGSEGAATAAAD